jgi:hypothetical protein
MNIRNSSTVALPMEHSDVDAPTAMARAERGDRYLSQLNLALTA